MDVEPVALPAIAITRRGRTAFLPMEVRGNIITARHLADMQRLC